MIQTMIFVAAINTLLHMWFGTRLPVVVATSTAFIIPVSSLDLFNRMSKFQDPRQVTL